MNLRTTLIAANAVLAGVLGVQLMLPVDPPQRAIMASWKDRPDSLESTTQLADSVVTGKVVKIRKADPIVTRFGNEPGGVDRIPVEVVTLELVDDDIKGKGRKGGKIEVFHTGHSDAASPMAKAPPKGPAPPKPKDGVEQRDAKQSSDHHMAVLFSGVMQDPAYKVGEEYVLFVRGGPRLKAEGADVQTMAIVSPEGRYRVNADQSVEPMSDKAFAKLLRGRGKKELRDKAAKAHGPKKP
jgi:hypothetical protein